MSNENFVQLILGDCLEVMKNIPDKSVDMILCDLPYGITCCGWDSVIPFKPLWEQYNRVAKINGAVVLFGSEPFSSKLRLSNLKNYKYDWIWRKPRGMGFLNAKRQPLRDFENISVFYKNQCTYNPQFTEGAPYSRAKSGKRSKMVDGGVTVYGKHGDGADFKNDNAGIRYPKQVLDFGVVERNTLHQTQKPVALLEYLIRTYTNEGEVVLDNCMGSGSTGAACVNTARSFIGIEVCGEIFEVARKRLSESSAVIVEYREEQ